MAILRIFFIILAIIFGALFLSYLVLAPYNEASKVIEYPYAISVQPSLISAEQSVKISLSSLQSEKSLSNFSLLIVDPLSVPMHYPVDNTTYANFTVPTDPKSQPLRTGNYSVVLILNTDDINNTPLLSTSFDVVPLPTFLYAFGSFAFSTGLGLMLVNG